MTFETRTNSHGTVRVFVQRDFRRAQISWSEAGASPNDEARRVATRSARGCGVRVDKGGARMSPLTWPELKRSLAESYDVVASEARDVERMANVARDYSPRAAAILRDYAVACEQVARLCAEYREERLAEMPPVKWIGRP